MLCYEQRGKAFSIKTILGNFVFINEENKSKEIQGKNVLSFTKFILGGFVRGVFRLGGFCPVTIQRSPVVLSATIGWILLKQLYVSA